VIALLLAMLGTGGAALGDSPIRYIVDSAHGVICYWLPYDLRSNRQPALSCLPLHALTLVEAPPAEAEAK